MDKNKNTLKGFTLIELIIVLAIFSVIMLLAMSFIDPVSQTMTDTSVREKTAAYVDNIGEYVDKSIRYSQFIRISENDFYKDGAVVSEQEAVVDFIDDFYDGAIKEDFTPVDGKVHVLKFINNSTGTAYQTGGIYETVYDFKAGDSINYILESDVDGTNLRKRWNDDLTVKVNVNAGDFVNGHYVDSNADNVDLSFPHSTVTVSEAEKQIVNEEHFKDYAYYYQLGLYEYLPVSDADLDIYGVAPDPKSKFYYSQLVKRLNGGIVEIQPSERQFSLNIVSYQVKGSETNKLDISYTPDGSTDPESIVLFKSPSGMNTVSMTLQNVITSKVADANSKLGSYYRVVQTEYYESTAKDNSSAGKGCVADGKVKLEPVTYTDMPFSYTPAATGSSVDFIYMIYTLPSEIYDSDITSAPVTTSPGSAVV